MLKLVKSFFTFLFALLLVSVPALAANGTISNTFVTTINLVPHYQFPEERTLAFITFSTTVNGGFGTCSTSSGQKHYLGLDLNHPTHAERNRKLLEALTLAYVNSRPVTVTWLDTQKAWIGVCEAQSVQLN